MKNRFLIILLNILFINTLGHTQTATLKEELHAMASEKRDLFEKRYKNDSEILKQSTIFFKMLNETIDQEDFKKTAKILPKEVFFDQVFKNTLYIYSSKGYPQWHLTKTLGIPVVLLTVGFIIVKIPVNNYLPYENLNQKQKNWITFFKALLNLGVFIGVAKLMPWINKKTISKAEERKAGLTEFVNEKLKETLGYKK